MIRQTLSSRCAALGIPSNGIFELTPRCNLRCKMCYVRMTPAQMAPMGSELSAEDWLSIAQSAKDAGMVFLLLTGGEPTLRTDFPQIYEHLAQMGFSISINTNGTLLTPALRELWHRLPPSQVNITLYGTSRDDYGRLCGEPDAFDRVTDALQWLQQEGILIRLCTTITPDNAGKWQEIEEFARTRNLDLRMTTYCFPPIRRQTCGPTNEFSRLSPETAAELLVKDMLFQDGAETVKRFAANLSTPPHAECDLGVGEAIHCMAGRAQFWISWNGRMTPCGMVTEPETQPLTQGFSCAWNTLREETAKIRLCPDCVSCKERESCMSCAAVAFAETGAYNLKPEYMCQFNRAYREQLTALAQQLQSLS